MITEHFNLTSPEGAVIAVLVLFSLFTWTVGVLKLVQYLRLQRRNKRFRHLFWQQEDLRQTLAQNGTAGALANLAQAALHAPERLKGRNMPEAQLPERVERALQQQIQRERRTLEAGLALLASIGTTSPFIGLFGTVWGIMAALRDISLAGSASLDTVAGPIGSALVATGIGIAVAVPAVLIYNYFQRRLKLAVADMDDFAHDVYSLMQAQGFQGAGFSVDTLRGAA